MRELRVLVVDDDPGYRAVVRVNLDLDGRVKVVGEAADGEEAVMLCQELRPDIVVLDLNMPNVDGEAAAERIAASCPSVRIVVLTSDDVGERADRLERRRIPVLNKAEIRADALASRILGL